MAFQTCPWGNLLQVGSSILTPSHQGDQFGTLFSVFVWRSFFLWRLGVNSEANAKVVGMGIWSWLLHETLQLNLKFDRGYPRDIAAGFEFDRGCSTRHCTSIWIWSCLLHETLQLDLNLIVATPWDIAAGFGSNNLVLHARVAIPTHPSISFSICMQILHPVT
jgi:hypothetical protein